jgi:hypothetical protein
MQSLNAKKYYAKLRHNELVVPFRQPKVKLHGLAHQMPMKIKNRCQQRKETQLGAMSVLISTKPFKTNTIWSFASDATTSLQKQVTQNKLKEGYGK